MVIVGMHSSKQLRNNLLIKNLSYNFIIVKTLNNLVNNYFFKQNNPFIHQNLPLSAPMYVFFCTKKCLLNGMLIFSAGFIPE